jgi:hypothetical protein
MKKLVTWGLVVGMLCSVNIAAWGGTIGVNVSEGASASVEKMNFDSDSITLTGNLGLNEKVLLWASYSTEQEKDSNDATYCLGARYEFMNNFAGIISYRDEDSLGTELDLGVRAQKNISNSLALVGQAQYQSFKDKNADSGYSLKAQAEYAFTPLVTGTLGAEFKDDDSTMDSSTMLLASLELYPTDQISWWVDYRLDHDKDEDTFGAGIEYKF